MRLGFIATIVVALAMTGTGFAATTDSSSDTTPIVKPPAPAASVTTTPAKPAATETTMPAKPPAGEPAVKTDRVKTDVKTKAATTKPNAKPKTATTRPASKKKAVAAKPTKKKQVAAKPKEPLVVITINKASQKMTVMVAGEKRYSWLVSTGAAGYTTPSGNFKPFRMEKDHFSKEWDDAPMPHSIFFTPEGHAIHGSPYTKRLGTRASHGCVRLAPQNAATLFALVQKAGMKNTRVIVKGGGGWDFFTSSIDYDDIQPPRWLKKIDPVEELQKMFDN